MRERLGGCDAVKRFKHNRGWNDAEDTAGGVSLEEITFRTMEPKPVLGRYLIKKILDSEDRIGGFNVQLA